MKKKLGLISILGTIGLAVIVFTLFNNNKITADIPSASSFAPTFKDWSIYFSEKMDPDSFTPDIVQVTDKDGNTVPIELVWNESKTILTLHSPVDGYQLNQDYKISVSSSAKTAKGSNLSEAFTHRFTAVDELPKINDKEQLVTLLKERMEKKEKERNLFSMQNEASDMDGAADDSAVTTESSGNDTSETNVQVAGIDEGDQVKTDGNFIYFARDTDIIIASTEIENSTIVSHIEEKNFFPNEIYLHNDLLISIGYSNEPIRDLKETKEPEERITEDIAIYPPIYSSQTAVHIYDISDRKKPKHVREISFEGSYNSSRLMDGYLYLIANERPPYRILEEEETEVRPFVKDSAVSTEGIPVDFEDMYFFPESQDETFMILASVNLNDLEKEASVDTYLGASNEIYMSKEHLYVAVRNYDSDNTSNASDTELMIWNPQAANTKITQFKVDQGQITYNSSTVVNGTLINQFAMDEQKDTFRVATTKGSAWDDDKPSTNNLYTFDLNLNPLGSVEGLAEGERIYSVRFMEDTAFMVTFKEIDPLFVIDLKEPTQPKVLGELKIPGFSNYLHPLDENHLIGFGQNTKLEENPHGSEPIVRSDGLKISVFDVTDLTNPIEKYSEVIGQGFSYTELNHNHKALYKHPNRNLFGFPATLFETTMVKRGDMTYEDQKLLFEGALLYEISPDSGITFQDNITHQEQMKEYPDWESEIKRIVSIGDQIYTISFDKIKVYDVDRKSVLEQIELPRMQRHY
ncbi:beta-propeller domain-containing protein [Ornithinibacillus halophilus]|uniref:Secreted protein containing C-terminal beta-propeller domain n=1 Tax=Ornithinibacillus halophilus TaxID=930117 RepID=A0A1M5I312_9BACI|nr:beta-propeller domain-containing protein [Ornithinibacillus halophilus]SHG22592.1 Secreted protein containing C-terminal beta-propeller domain [Ornithinibacillus halophilus]